MNRIVAELELAPEGALYGMVKRTVEDAVDLGLWDRVRAGQQVRAWDEKLGQWIPAIVVPVQR